MADPPVDTQKLDKALEELEKTGGKATKTAAKTAEEVVAKEAGEETLLAGAKEVAAETVGKNVIKAGAKTAIRNKIRKEATHELATNLVRDLQHSLTSISEGGIPQSTRIAEFRAAALERTLQNAERQVAEVALPFGVLEGMRELITHHMQDIRTALGVANPNTPIPKNMPPLVAAMLTTAAQPFDPNAMPKDMPPELAKILGAQQEKAAEEQKTWRERIAKMVSPKGRQTT
jgi:hypothetical protein